MASCAEQNNNNNNNNPGRGRALTRSEEEQQKSDDGVALHYGLDFKALESSSRVHRW